MIARRGVAREPGALARAILEIAVARPPDLSPVTVLLPTLHGAPALARALCAAAGVAVLIPPRLATLRQFAETVLLNAPVLPDSRRVAMIHETLTARGWLDPVRRWAAAEEMVALFDELTAERIGLPDSLDDWQERLMRASPGVDAYSFDARVSFTLWQVLHQGPEMDVQAAYQARLARLAQGAGGELFVVDDGSLSHAEREFVEVWGESAPACLLVPDDDPPEAGKRARFVGAALDPQPDRIPLLERARAFGDIGGAAGLSLVGAASLEDTARVATLAVRAWLAAGARDIAVVAIDRVAARRARALLEREGVLLQDETGWALSTTAAATAVMRFLECVAGDFFHTETLDLLKSPFVFADWDADRRKRAAYGLDQALRRHNVASGVERFLDAVRAADDGQDAAEALQRLRSAQARLRGRGRPLAEWCGSLHEALGEIGVAQGLGADEAGREVIALLGRLSEELSGHARRASFGEFRLWLSRRMETALFTERNITSPVRLTHLAAAAWRPWDGVVMVGADAAHLPPPAVAGFFGEGTRASLGLPSVEARARIMRGNFVGLLSHAREAVMVWQAQQGRRKNPPSPWVARLDAFHEAVCGRGLEDPRFASWLAVPEPIPADAAGPSSMPQPVVPAALVPARLSATGHQDLISCPYRFFVRRVLGLGEAGEISEALDHRDYGEIVHGLLQHFHASHPVFLEQDEATLVDEMLDAADAAFARAVRDGFLAHGFRLALRAAVPAYVAWQRKREAEGWRWRAGEAWQQRELAEAGISVEGKLDRLDARAADTAVLDYKTGDLKPFRERLRVPGEDVQLAHYALLLPEPPADVRYARIHRHGGEAALDRPVADEAAGAAARLGRIFAAMREGRGLPANGVDGVCKYCEASGLCRKGTWSES